MNGSVDMSEMLERRKPDLLMPLKGHAKNRKSRGKKQSNALDALRAAVTLTKDAVHAVGVTAIEAVREGAAFIGLSSPAEELQNPFSNLDAPIWEQHPPQEIINIAYDYCESLTRIEAGNFYHSFKYLPDEQRRAMCAVYAFCRRADDIADGDWKDVFQGSLGEDDPEAMAYREKFEELSNLETVIDEEAYRTKLAQLFFFRKKLSTCYNGLTSTDPVFLALKDTVQNYNIPQAYFGDLISGMEDDLFNNRYDTFDQLYVYCYRVASVVGLMCIEIYGYENEEARKYAESWGIFMQLTNVLRDVSEDINRDRVYLPLNELKENNISIEELDGTVLRNKQWEAYTYHYAKRARTYLEEAQKLLPLIPRRSRYSPAAMAAFYDAILKQIIKRQGDVFSSRVRLNKAQKIWLAAAVYVRHRFLPFFLTPIWDFFSKFGLLPRV